MDKLGADNVSVGVSGVDVGLSHTAWVGHSHNADNRLSLDGSRLFLGPYRACAVSIDADEATVAPCAVGVIVVAHFRSFDGVVDGLCGFLVSDALHLVEVYSHSGAVVAA